MSTEISEEKNFKLPIRFAKQNDFYKVLFFEAGSNLPASLPFSQTPQVLVFKYHGAMKGPLTLTQVPTESGCLLKLPVEIFPQRLRIIKQLLVYMWGKGTVIVSFSIKSELLRLSTTLSFVLYCSWPKCLYFSLSKDSLMTDHLCIIQHIICYCLFNISLKSSLWYRCSKHNI